MEEKESQVKERVQLSQRSGYVCANISASETNPFWLPIAVKVDAEEFARVTRSPAWKEGYASLYVACQWGTPYSRERVANDLGEMFPLSYRRHRRSLSAPLGA